jgi:hypothetical protein
MTKNIGLKVSVIGAVTVISLAVFATGAFAKQSDNERPGWGFGDHNHVHTGPPGKSVHPGHGDGDNDGDDQGHNSHQFPFFGFDKLLKFNFWDLWHHQH